MKTHIPGQTLTLLFVGLAFLTQVQAGEKASSFTRISNNGAELTSSAVLGPHPADWGCTRDNNTGLMWEMKNEDKADLHFSMHTFTWYSPENTPKGGDPGSMGRDTCEGTLSAYGSQCNTANFISAVNSSNLCGHNDWRLPNRTELKSIVDMNFVNPSIDASYFPNTIGFWYWTNNTHETGASLAWVISFLNGNPYASIKTINNMLRLVRGTLSTAYQPKSP
ncbi:exported hypothetical protein [Gammaproteobacteria bacterium]